MRRDRPKIILTGGHLSPLLAVYDALKRRAECVIVGRKYTFENDKTVSLEYKLFTEKNANFYDVNAGRFQRKISPKTIPSLLKIPVSLLNSIKIINKEKPGVVLTFGGYVGLPVAIAAYLSRVPVVLHEQTQKAGITNKLIGRFAKKICISFPSSKDYFDPAKTVLTGNPVRKEIFFKKLDINLPRDYKVLLVMGGSTGSHNINEYIELLLPRLLESFVVVHQTGDAEEFKDYERLSKLRRRLEEKLKSRYMLKKFILPSEIGSLYSFSDIVVSRAGANTVSELIALSKKAVLIPLSHGQKSEQFENAKYYKNSGLGTYIEEKNINLDNLFSEILNTLNKKETETVSRHKDSENAAEKISTIILSEVKNG